MIKLELIIRHTKGKPDITCPFFVCDYCKEKIEQAGQGMIHWRDDKAKGYSVIDESLVILHKHPCSRQLEADEHEMGISGFQWWGLDSLIGYLINNSEMDWGRLIELYCPPSKIMDVKRTVRSIKKDDAGLMGRIF